MKIFLLLIALTLNFALVVSDSEELRSASHNESCDALTHCHPHKNLDCIEGTCQCPGDTDFDMRSEDCVIPPRAENGFKCTTDTMCQLLSSYGNHSRCSAKFRVCECYSLHEHVVRILNTCYVDKRIGDSCVTRLECNATIEGEAECVDLSCQCASGYFNVSRQECHQKEPFDSVCIWNEQCQGSSLGHLSRCSQKTQKCECWDMDGNGKSDTKRLNGKCFFVRGRDEECSFKEECELGFHPNSDCTVHPAYNDQRVCQCQPNRKCAASGSGVHASSFVFGFVVLLKLV